MKHLLIVSLSRSGGKLLRMLLDGHSQVNALPFEHWNRASKGDYPARRIARFARLSADDKIATAGAPHVEQKLRRFHSADVVSAVMREWRTAGADAPTLALMYERFVHAYFTTVGKDPSRIVVNHCGSLCRFSPDQLNALYGPGRHLLTIRDPRAVFASMTTMLYRKFTIDHVERGKVSAAMVERHIEKLEPVNGVSSYVREFCDAYRHMVSEHATRPEVIRIRFEDLVTDPNRVMRQLATDLAIPWEESLLEPTELGVSRAPNSSFGRRGGGIHGSAAHDWATRIEPAARDYIEATLGAEMMSLGYAIGAAAV